MPIVVRGLTDKSYKNNGVYKDVFRREAVGPQWQNRKNIFGDKLDIISRQVLAPLDRNSAYALGILRSGFKFFLK